VCFDQRELNVSELRLVAQHRLESEAKNSPRPHLGDHTDAAVSAAVSATAQDPNLRMGSGGVSTTRSPSGPLLSPRDIINTVAQNLTADAANAGSSGAGTALLPHVCSAMCSVLDVADVTYGRVTVICVRSWSHAVHWQGEHLLLHRCRSVPHIPDAGVLPGRLEATDTWLCSPRPRNLNAGVM